jgi:hypothetical protein
MTPAYCGHRPEIERLRRLLAYDEETGHLTWRKRERSGMRQNRGDRAGWKCGNGYRCIAFDGRAVLEHRIIFAIMTGAWPPADTDHVNGIADDNRWINLRPATRAQNNGNRVGVVGIVRTRSGKWKAQIKASGQNIHIGTFKMRDEALFRRRFFALAQFGEYARQ